MASTQGGEAARIYPAPMIAWYGVFVLFLLYGLSIVDRLIISLLVGPIRSDLGISDFQFSLLQGVAFGIFYATFALPIGALVDRHSRRKLIFWGVCVWSLATLACGSARSYLQLFLARIGVSAGESTLSPASYSMLADSFPPQRLTTAMTLFSLGGFVGYGMAYMLGGAIITLASAGGSISLPLLGEVHPWQQVFMIVGIPGILLAFLALSFPEPPRHDPGVPGHGREAIRELFAFMSTRRRFFVCHHVGFTLALAVVTGLALWYPAYLSRTFGWSPGKIGWVMGVLVIGASCLGAPLAGKLIDRSFAAGRHDAHLRWMMLGSLVAAVVGVIALTSRDVIVFLAGVAVLQAFSAGVLGIGATSLQIATPGRLRGRASAFYFFVSSLLGSGIGSSVIGAFTDFLFRDDAKLGYSMALMVALYFPAAALFFYAGLKSMRQAVATVQE